MNSTDHNTSFIPVKTFILLFFSFLSTACFSQIDFLHGTIQDGLTKEPIGFASIYLKNNGNGKITDSSGNFRFNIENFNNDTLMVSYIGYETFAIPLNLIDTKNPLNISLERKGKSGEVVVKLKINKGLFLWKKIMSKKKYFDRTKKQNYAYEAYNKIEIDLKNLNVKKLKRNFILKPFGFVFDNVDSSSEPEPFLPAYLIESISDYSYQKSPKKTHENIKALSLKGIENESITKFLGVMNQNVNIFDNYISVLGKDFISPFNDNGDFYYTFSVADTQIIDNKKTFHFIFKPKRSGENVFEGEAWVRAGTFVVTKISMFLGKDANINFISRIGIVQEYTKIDDTTFFLGRDKFFADFNALGKKSLTLIGRKTTSYRNIVINSDSISKELNKQKIEEIVETNAKAKLQADSNWTTLRHDSLTKNEKQIYETVDKLLAMPKFQKLQKTLRFIGTGYKNVGLFEIGPWFNWISNNSLEGYRFRFDLGTNTKLFKNIYLHGYLAYGTKDNSIKGKAEAYWIANRDPNRLILHASISEDIDNGISEIGQVSQDNIFSLAIRKPNVSQKFIRLKERNFDINKDWGNGFSSGLYFSNRSFEPLKYLPNKLNYLDGESDLLSSFEIALKLRFAYLEQFLNWDYFRYSLGSKYPITEVTFTKGISGILNSKNNYTKITAAISDDIKINPLGKLSVKVYGGSINGVLPFAFLENHLGNDIYYYNSNSLNLMNRFEYLSDKYAGINLEHQIGSGIFKLIPLTRKLKWRQFWNIKSLWGSLSEENKKLNGTDNYFKSLNNNMYTEVGTGIDNIFKVCRIDFVWNITPNSTNLARGSKFGIFGSFRIQF